MTCARRMAAVLRLPAMLQSKFILSCLVVVRSAPAQAKSVSYPGHCNGRKCR